ncbi:MAG: DUF1573 domain-containing protein, partial [Nanoarchaeota archaeon]|nr:DUF1573 domain-containing protein [Nanoarchaeota archaeon]
SFDFAQEVISFMKTKNIIIGIGALALLGVLFWVGKPSEEPAKNTEEPKTDSALTADISSFDFGTIRMKDGNVEKIFILRNAGESEVRLAKVFTSCMCTTAFLEKGEEKKGPFGMPGHGGLPANPRLSIAPGEEMRVRVVYDPNAHGPAGVGLVERTIHLVEENGAEKVLSIRSMVTP